MIVIISENTDVFTSTVEDWLNLYQREYIRINSEHAIGFFSWELSNCCCDCFISEKIGCPKIILTESTVWHRRGKINFLLHFNSKDLKSEYLYFINDESVNLFNATMLVLNDKKLLLGTHIFQKNNRLYNQYLAIKFGFKTPATLITTSKDELKSFKSKYLDLITKPISNIFMKAVAGKHLRGEVKDFQKESMKLLPENFFPMLFQEKIVREFEVRVFYFHGTFYPMAVMLDNDENKKTDIREANEKLMRQVPIKISSDVENKMIKILQAIKLDTASFDFIVDENGDFYFLELNPFGMLNNMILDCNYPIDKNIAKFLIDYDTK